MITGLILAGGRGSRMGSVDKGLQVFRGAPMALHVMTRLAPQVGDIMINANTNLAPCDSPFLPGDLVARLGHALIVQDADLAVAVTKVAGEPARRQAHPVFCLMKTSVLSHLSDYLHNGGRRIDAWYATLKVAEVCFDDDTAFRNINTLED